jgi:hypothetical protein
MTLTGIYRTAVVGLTGLSLGLVAVLMTPRISAANPSPMPPCGNTQCFIGQTSCTYLPGWSCVLINGYCDSMSHCSKY